MGTYDYEQTLFSFLENLKQQINVRPLNLGGVYGTGGGTGGPPGGFIGFLPQTRITFDTTEAETWSYTTISGVPSGVSLVTNLNRIRYRLGYAERKQVVFSFEGNATVGANPVRIYNFTGARTIEDIYASVGVAPTGSSLIADVNLDGTTVFTNQSNRPTISGGEFYAHAPAVDVSAWNVNSYITVDLDQVGATLPGEYAIIYVVYVEG